MLIYDPANFRGTLCETVTLTCQTVNLQSHRWIINDRAIVTYTYSPSVPAPFTIYDKGGINILVTVSDPIGGFNADNFNGTSVLTTKLRSIVNNTLQSVSCGTNSIRSEVLMIQQHLSVMGKE